MSIAHAVATLGHVLGGPVEVVLLAGVLGWLGLACTRPQLAHAWMLILLAWVRSPESVTALDGALRHRETPR